MEILLPAIFLFVLVPIMFYLERRSQVREWNGGVCAKNGIPWKSFDTDSGGSVGCSAGTETIWVYSGVMADTSNLPKPHTSNNPYR